MVLEMEDPRTEEEKERDRQREAEEKTYRLIGWQVEQDLEAGRELLAELRQLTEQLEGIAAQAAGMLTEAQDITQRLEQTLETTRAPGGRSKEQQVKPSLPLTTPEEMAAGRESVFGPGFHFQRPMELYSLAGEWGYRVGD
jgi:seryl-tRNA synthetase